MTQVSLETSNKQPSSATRLVAQHFTDSIDMDMYDEKGTCCFCGTTDNGCSSEDAISHKYFTDYDLIQEDTGHVCWACAYCMSQKSLKNGHWIATADEYVGISTSDLRDEFERLRNEVYSTPLAVHLSENPIQSEHAYLWTPVVHSTSPLALDYAGQSVTVEWQVFDSLLEAVEDLRWHGFRLDDIRSGEPRLKDLDSIGIRQYSQVNSVVDPYRRTALLEVAITLSRPAKEQNRDETVDGNTTLSNYV